MQVARLQALFTVLWLATALAWVLTHLDAPAWACAGALAILGGHAGVLGLEFLAQRLKSRHDSVPPPRAAQLWRAWMGEVLASARLFGWRQPFCSRNHANQLGPQHRGTRGVLLVHGYMCNRGAWNPWMERLILQGRPFLAVDLEPVFGEIDLHVPAVEAALLRMTRSTGLAPLVVGHSMGGLVLRAWLRQTGAPERAHRLVTLGTPHHGTWLARFAHTANARQMRPASPWLRALDQGTPAAWRRHFVCFYSNADNIVFPPSHAMLAGADNRLVQGLAHVQLADEAAVMDEVLALLDAPALAPEGHPLVQTDETAVRCMS